MSLTPADVRNKQFSTTRLRPGYDEEEVDAFLDEVEVELDRLIQENEELRSKLAECLRGGKTAVSALSSPLADPEPEMLAPEPIMPEPEHRPEPVRASMPSEDNMDTAARVLALAQQTADQAIADARREADETLGRARREADEILGKARRATWRRAPRTVAPSPRSPGRSRRSPAACRPAWKTAMASQRSPAPTSARRSPEGTTGASTPLTALRTTAGSGMPGASRRAV